MSTIGINEQQPRNLEISRSAELLPEQIRVTATNFLQLLEEYYKFMNLNEIATVKTSVPNSSKLSGKSGSGPTNIIHSVLTQTDPDIVDEDYLTHIVSAIAPYVPLPSYMSTTSTVTVNPPALYKYHTTTELAFLRAQLYRKMIKYFYSTRGSRNSVETFFRIFYNVGASIIDNNDYPSTIQYYVKEWLTTSGMPIEMTAVSGGPLVYGQTPMQAWTPFTYVISTSVVGGASTFDVPYQTMVHPIGFKYHFQPSGGNGETMLADGRMVHAREDYQKALWCLDSTPIAEYQNYRVGDASNPYVVDNQNTSNYTYADWSNIGCKARYDQSNMLGLVGLDYLTTPITSTSQLFYDNISPGKEVRNMTSTSAIPYNTTITRKKAVDFSVNTFIYSTSTASLQILFNSNIIPGLFVTTASGATIAYPLNTYVTSVSSKSTASTSTVVLKDIVSNTDYASDMAGRNYWNSTSGATSTNIITFRMPHNGIRAGDSVTGSGIPVGTFVQAIARSTSVVVNDSVNVTTAGLDTFSFSQEQNADFLKIKSVVEGLYIRDSNKIFVDNQHVKEPVKLYRVPNAYNKFWTMHYVRVRPSIDLTKAWARGKNTLTFSKFIVVLSSAATSTVTGNITFSAQGQTVYLSANPSYLPQPTTNRAADITFYGGVIDLTSTSTNFTALTDRIEIDA